MKFPNSVAQFREQRGLTREQLAEAASVTRQTIGLIEAGKICPSTVVSIRLSKVLGVPVEELFADPDEIWPLMAAPEDMDYHEFGAETTGAGQRVWAGRRAGKNFVRPVDAAKWNVSAHAIWEGAPSGASPYSRQTDERVPEGRLAWLAHPSVASSSVFISGCDGGLGLLADILGRRSSSLQGVWFEVPNERALRELRDGYTHVAAIHGPWDVNKGLSAGEYLFVHFASSQMGWMVQRGNPKGFQSVYDLQGGGLRFVNRPKGSGARRHVDELLTRSGVNVSSVTGYHIEADGHAAVAQAVAQGIVDVGFGHAAAAAARRLTFMPVLEELCTLVIPKGELQHPGVQALLETIQMDKFRFELGALGPYEVSQTGKEWSGLS